MQREEENRAGKELSRDQAQLQWSCLIPWGPAALIAPPAGASFSQGGGPLYPCWGVRGHPARWWEGQAASNVLRSWAPLAARERLQRGRVRYRYTHTDSHLYCKHKCRQGSMNACTHSHSHTYKELLVTDPQAQ